MSRILETVLTGRNLLSPVLATAAADVTAFNSTVAAANDKAAVSSSASAKVQEAAAGTSASASSKAATAATTGAGVQSKAATDVVQANTRAGESATASADVQSRAYAKTAESATLSSKAQDAANRGLASANGLLGTSLTPLTAGLGLVGLGLGYAAYRGAEFDAAMSQVQAATMGTADQMALLRDAAIDQGAKTKYSSEEAAQGITEMAKAGVSTADILGGGLAGALSLAAAGQISVGDAAEIAATQLTVFQLRGDQVNHVADLLAAGAGKAQGSVADLALALQYAGLPAKGLGMNIEDTTGTLALFASAGLVGEKAGTSFRGMLTSVTNATPETRKEMDALNLSFFDGQGKFIGMAGVAQQLHDKLGPLTEETRNQALAQIFGNVSLGAAQVLYNSGAAGVQNWTDKVNDAGYAARQAAINQDNLKGDLEKLGGAFDSTMTSIGAGAQGPLRDLVQALTGIVTIGSTVIGFFSNLPGPVQIALVALAGVAALKGPVTSALETVALKALYMGESMAGAAGMMSSLKAGASGLLGVFGGPWGLAIAGVVTGLAFLIPKLMGSGDASAFAAAGTKNLTEALNGTQGAITATVRAAAAKDLQAGGLLDWAKQAGIATSTLTDAVLGVPGAMDQVTASSGSTGTALEQLASKGLISAGAVDGLASKSDGALGALQRMADQTASSVTAQQNLAVAAGQAGTALDNGITPANDNATALDAVAKAASDGDKAVSNLKTSLDILSGNYVNLVDAQAAVQDAVSKATGALKDQGGEVLNAGGQFDIYTANGRAAIDVADGIRDKGGQLIATMEQQGKSTLEVSQAQADLRAQFITAVGVMGVTGQAAEDLATAYLGVPKDVQTQINANTINAQADVAALQGQIDGTGQKAPILLTADPTLGNVLADGFQAKIDAIKQGKAPGIEADTYIGQLQISGFQAIIDAVRQGVPPGVTADTDQGKTLLYQFQGAIDDIQQNRVPNLDAHTDAGFQAVLALQRQIDALHGKSVDVIINQTTRVITSTGAAAPTPLGYAQQQAIGGIVHAYAGGGFEPMQGGVAQLVKPNTWRIIGDRVTDDEAYIPINGSPRSQAILAQTADRMGYSLAAAPAASPGYSGLSAPAAMPGYGPAGGSATVVHNHYEGKKTAIAVDATGLGADQIAQAVATIQRREEFLTGV